MKPARSTSCSLPVLARRSFAKYMGAMLLLLAVPMTKAGAAGPPPDGVYTLMKISGSSLINLGPLEIKGGTYRVGDDKTFAPFTQDAAGTITWSAGLNFMPDGWKLGKSTYVGLDEFKKPLIRINYMSPRQAAEVIDCVKEK